VIVILNWPPVAVNLSEYQVDETTVSAERLLCLAFTQVHIDERQEVAHNVG